MVTWIANFNILRELCKKVILLTQHFDPYTEKEKQKSHSIIKNQSWLTIKTWIKTQWNMNNKNNNTLFIEGIK